MQYILGLILLLYSPFSYELPSLNTQCNYRTFVETYYPEGVAAFENQMQQHLQYPSRSVQNCEVGEAIVEIEFGGTQKIKKVSFLNPLSKSLNLSIVKALESTNGQWHPAVSNKILTMSFAFKIDNGMEITGDILTSGVQLFGPGVPCRSDEAIMGLMHEKLTKQQYRKALDYCIELIRRSPRKLEYQKLYRNIMDKLL